MSAHFFFDATTGLWVSGEEEATGLGDVPIAVGDALVNAETPLEGGILCTRGQSVHTEEVSAKAVFPMRTYMRQHDDAVARQVQVRFERVRPSSHGAVERGHRVLREGRLVAPVADVHGQLMLAGQGGGYWGGDGAGGGGFFGSIPVC